MEKVIMRMNLIVLRCQTKHLVNREQQKQAAYGKIILVKKQFLLAILDETQDLEI